MLSAARDICSTDAGAPSMYRMPLLGPTARAYSMETQDLLWAI